MLTQVEGATRTRIRTVPDHGPVSLGDVAGLRVHLIGVGGSGMSAVARVLIQMGARVSGSDLVPFDGLGDLVERGGRIVIGGQAGDIDADVELVVASAAVKEDNAELATARRSGLPVMKYAELLGALMARYRGVAVAGTHGKSTTTALTAHVFRSAGLDPSFVVGAKSAQLGGGSDVGSGPHLIVEACEFDRSFLQFRPESAAILNIEPDHLDCFRDLEDIVDAFSRFAAQVSSDGLLVCHGDDPVACRAARHAGAPVETFGFEEGDDWRAVVRAVEAGCFVFDVQYRGQAFCSTRLSIPGRHNVGNALAAIALAHHAGAEPAAIAQAVTTYAGVDRRLTWRGEGRGVTLLDDYAHHPTEIRVTVEAARECYQPGRLWVVFQPHQCSRTHHFMDAFAEALQAADEVIIPDVFGAREADSAACRKGAEELVARVSRRGGRAMYLDSLGAVTSHLLSHMAGGDLIMTMGAGDVWKVADELVERICTAPAA